ncbi:MULTISPECIES: MFS transporter [Thalassospira]|nr:MULTISPECIES: MFS transporter [Thalassospira]MCH2275404.1 MFS transporter [Thalassospira sp.]
MMTGGIQTLSIRWQIHLLFIIQLVSMGAMEMSGPFWPVHLRSLSQSDDLFTFASIAVYVGPMLGIMLTSTFWGRLGDRFGHKAMMMRALFGLAITQLALAYANDVWLILMLRFLQGACAGYIAPAQAYGVSIESPARRAKLFAYLQVSTNVGSLGGALVGGVILDHAAFFWINFSAAILCAVCLGSVWAFLPVVVPKDAGRGAVVNVAPTEKISILRSPQIVSLLTILGVLLLGRMVTQSPFSIYVLNIFDVGNWIVGLCYGLLALGFVVSASLWARHFEGRAARDVLGGMCLVIAGCVVVTLLAGATRSIFVFTAMYFIWGVLLGATTPVLTALVSRAAGDYRQGHVLGLAQSTAQFASIAGIALGGWFSQAAGLSNIYFLVGLVYAIGFVLTVFARARAFTSARPSEIPGE